MAVGDTWVVGVLSITNHSIASSRPAPCVADVLKICHVLLFSAARPSSRDTSAGVRAPSRSWRGLRPEKEKQYLMSAYRS